jgi:hypothetical protein
MEHNKNIRAAYAEWRATRMPMCRWKKLLEQNDQQDDEKDQAANTNIHERSPKAPLPMRLKPIE